MEQRKKSAIFSFSAFEARAFFTISLLLIFFIASPAVFASTTDGTIDSVYKYAWFENAGWINFGLSGGNVHITDSAVTGYAWNENYGWINLNPSTGGVKNDGNGNLSGYAWGENLGWINFTGVTVDSGGEFKGYATITNNNGRINFNCSNGGSCGVSDFKVKTDYRPKNFRPVASGGGGGAVLPPDAYTLRPPDGGFKVLINNGLEKTSSTIVELYLFGGPDAQKVSISDSPDFKNSLQEDYFPVKDRNLCEGLISCAQGAYNVYVKFYNKWGYSSEIFSAGIIYQKESVISQIIRQVPKVFEKISDFFKPPALEIKPPVAEKPVSQKAPLVFKGDWTLLPAGAIRDFVLAPLPEEFRSLARKFPQLNRIFKEVGIIKITDVGKLAAIDLKLPGLTEASGFSNATSAAEGISMLKKLSLAQLPLTARKQIPSGIIFVKTSGGLMDFNNMLTVSGEGNPQQKIRTIVNEPIQLVIKPDQKVKSVKGYTIFKSKSGLSRSDSDRLGQSSREFRLYSLLGSVLFNLEALKQEYNPRDIENRLVLQKFEFTDPDADGIYTADIVTPAVDGNYEVIAVMDYVNPRLAAKEVRLINVVDPEGYVYESYKGKEIRIPNAVVTLYWLDPSGKKYEAWPAKDYQQENPQITDNRGAYAFLVPEGVYYIKVETPGYLDYESKTFNIQTGSGVHYNIELKNRYWWLDILDWRTIGLVVLALLILYNFYKDKLRERFSQTSKQ